MFILLKKSIKSARLQVSVSFPSWVLPWTRSSPSNQISLKSSIFLFINDKMLQRPSVLRPLSLEVVLVTGTRWGSLCCRCSQPADWVDPLDCHGNHLWPLPVCRRGDSFWLVPSLGNWLYWAPVHWPCRGDQCCRVCRQGALFELASVRHLCDCVSLVPVRCRAGPLW